MPAVSVASFDETDDHPAAVAHRSRRAERIAVNTREAVGHPGGTNARGEKVDPDGLWAFVIKLDEKVDQVLEKVDSLIAKDATAEESGGKKRSWVAARGERLLDAVLISLMLGLGAYLASHVQYRTPDREERPAVPVQH
jgi:hypothetical protein